MIGTYFSSYITYTEKKKKRIKKILATDKITPELVSNYAIIYFFFFKADSFF